MNLTWATHCRDEIDVLKERMSSSTDTLASQVTEKEHEVEDAMMIVSLLQEQIKEDKDSGQVIEILQEIRDKNSLLPKLTYLEIG